MQIEPVAAPILLDHECKNNLLLGTLYKGYEIREVAKQQGLDLGLVWEFLMKKDVPLYHLPERRFFIRPIEYHLIALAKQDGSING